MKKPSPKKNAWRVPGFRVAGMHCGIKTNGKPDLALIVPDAPAVAAGIFTRNRVRSPSVLRSEKILRAGKKIAAVIVNSGNANACTGPQGMAACDRISTALARELAADGGVLTASTGIIGVPLPADKIVRALPRLAAALSENNWNATARAIMTTDLVPKSAFVQKRIGGKTVTFGGISKGSGMIHPDMATMLAFVCTDAAIEPGALRSALRLAGDATFNSITVDGDCSTNDSLICLAGGRAGNKPIRAGSADYKTFLAALTEICDSLARQIVLDGEGATKFVTVRVRGAQSLADARKAADAVATSSLVKTALFGADPNWGRILCAVGYSGAAIRQERVAIALNGLPLVRNGVPLASASQKLLRERMLKKTIDIDIDLQLGSATAEKYTCDFSYDYVRINAEYTT